METISRPLLGIHEIVVGVIMPVDAFAVAQVLQRRRARGKRER